jgi:hypothetical protein
LGALVVFFAGQACLAQKITVDPNMGRASQSIEVDASDSRVAQKVTYEAWHTPIKTILADLSKSTGVTLNAGYSKQDWQVRDRRMNIYVKDLTLAQLMNSIARVMKFKWSRNDDKKPPTYRLVADRRLLAKLQAEASKREAELKAEEIRRRTALVDGLARAAEASGPELEALKRDSPYLGLSAVTGFAKMVTRMFAEQPKLKDMFTSAERMAALNSSEFSLSTQKLCVDVLRYGNEHWADRKGVPDDGEDDIAKHELHLECIAAPVEADQRKRLTYFGYVMAFMSDGTHFVSDLKEPEAPSSKVSGAYRLSISEQPRDSQDGWGKFQAGENSGMQDDAKVIEHYQMFDPVVDHPDEPELHNKLVLNLSKEDQQALREQIQATGGRATSRLMYQALIRATAQAAKMSVVSDSYSVVLSDRQQFADGELKSVLDNISDVYRCNWEKHGSIVEFRRRDWFRRRASQVADEWLKPWRDQVEKDGIPALNTYASMLSLTDEQVEENIASDYLLGQVLGPWWDYGVNRGFCRFYTQLNDYQRGQFFTDQGLRPRTLAPAQGAYYTAMFTDGWHRTWSTEDLSDPQSTDLKVTASGTTKDDGSNTYKFTVSRPNEDGSTKTDSWTIPLRKVVRLKDIAGSK